MHGKCSLLWSLLDKSNKLLHKRIGTPFRACTCKHIYLYTPKDSAVFSHLVLFFHIEPGWLHSRQQCEVEVQNISFLVSAINMGSESGSFRLKYNIGCFSFFWHWNILFSLFNSPFSNNSISGWCFRLFKIKHKCWLEQWSWSLFNRNWRIKSVYWFPKNIDSKYSQTGTAGQTFWFQVYCLFFPFKRCLLYGGKKKEEK